MASMTHVNKIVPITSNLRKAISLLSRLNLGELWKRGFQIIVALGTIGKHSKTSSTEK